MLALLQTELVPKIPLAEWTESGVDWITETFDGAFDLLDSAIDLVIGTLEFVLLSPPALVMVVILGVIALLLAGWRVALFTVLGLLFVISLDLWEAAMQTLALVLAATVVALADALQSGTSAISEDYHGRGQPGHHALALDGGHRWAGRGGGSRRAGRDGPEPAQRRDQLRRRGRYRGHRHHARPRYSRYDEGGQEEPVEGLFARQETRAGCSRGRGVMR